MDTPRSLKSIYLAACIGLLSVPAYGSATYKVVKRDSLSQILYQRLKNLGIPPKGKLYGPGKLVEQTQRLNPGLRDPNVIYTGSILLLPEFFERAVIESRAKPWPRSQEIVISPGPVPLTAPLLRPENVSDSIANQSARWSVNVAVGLSRSDRSESVGGVQTTTNGIYGAPKLWLGIDRERIEEPGLPRWRYGGYASAQKNSEVAGRTLPWEGALGVRAERQGLPTGLGIALEYDQISQATPDSSATSSSQVIFSVRTTRAVWFEPSIHFTGHFSELPSTLRIGVGLAPWASAATDRAGTSAVSARGIRVRANWDVDLGVSPFARVEAQYSYYSGDQGFAVSGKSAAVGLGLRF